MSKELVKEFLLKQNLSAHFESLEKYVKLLQTANVKFNLTGFDENKIWTEGIYVSLILMFEALQHYKPALVADVGSGGGFPAIVYSIVFPKLKLVLIEKSTKKANFLISTCKTLKLNCQVISKKAETINQKFDFITAMALAPLKKLIPLIEPIKSQKAKVFLFKGPLLATEIKEAHLILKKHKVKYEVVNVAFDCLNLTRLIFIWK